MKIINLKKAAMFGLDARIALAIFGALSVISGAALYSAIKEAKITSILTEFKEIEKAISQYMLDTSQIIPKPSTSQNLFDLSIIALLEQPSGVTNWHGPYINYTKASSNDYIVYKNGTVALAYRKTGDWGSFESTDMWCYQTSISCNIWLGITGLDLETAKALETKIDGTVNPANSNFTGKFNYDGGASHMMTDIPFPPSKSVNP